MNDGQEDKLALNHIGNEQHYLITSWPIETLTFRPKKQKKALLQQPQVWRGEVNAASQRRSHEFIQTCRFLWCSNSNRKWGSTLTAIRFTLSSESTFAASDWNQNEIKYFFHFLSRIAGPQPSEGPSILSCLSVRCSHTLYCTWFSPAHTHTHTHPSFPNQTTNKCSSPSAPCQWVSVPNSRYEKKSPHGYEDKHYCDFIVTTCNFSVCNCITNFFSMPISFLVLFQSL